MRPRLEIQSLEPNRARVLAKALKLQVTLKRLPTLHSLEQVDDARFSLFTKQLWKGIYDEVPESEKGYTVLLVPQYFDFIKLKSFFRRRNALVVCISEYSDKRDAQKYRSSYEQKDVPVLMVTERALVFEKIRIRFCRNLIMYGLPESPDIIDSL